MANLVAFEHRTPSAQTAVDVFRGRWASDLGPLLGVTGTGPHPLFTADARPALAARSLGLATFERMDILEIGPLEGAHSHALEKLGARSVTAIESNAEAWLKCLVVKELLGLERTSFLMGNALGYLDAAPRRFDLVFASGVLYHMADPAELIRRVADVSDRCFVWTHVYDPGHAPAAFRREGVERFGIGLDYWRHSYGQKTDGFWGGIDATAAWLTREHLFAAFAAAGLARIDLIEETPDHPNGAAVTFTAMRG